MKFKTIFLVIILLLYTAVNLNAQSWTQVGNTFYGEKTEDRLGSSIALNNDGSIVAVGTKNWEFEGTDYGKVQVFINNDGAWEQLGQDIQGTTNSECGYSVALNDEGNILAVGSKTHSTPGIGNAGSVDIYIYNQETELWEQIGQKLIGDAAYDKFSYSISLNSQGNRIVISAPWNDISVNMGGVVRVFEYNETTELWEQLGSNILGENEGERIGTALDINSEGNIIGIGADYYSVGKAYIGRVRLYEFDENLTEWVQIGQDMIGQSAGDHFGKSISLNQSGNTVICGAPSVGNAGEIRVYELISDTWTQVGNEITGEQYDYLGTKVSISDDASKIVGSSYYSTDAKGFVKIYEKIDNNWVQLGSTIWGDDADDRFGTQIAFSNNGNIVAGGTIYDDDNGENAGQVKVFSCVCENLPTPDLAELPEITDECYIDLSTYTPTATSDCGLTINGTTPQLVFDEQGTYTITWSYDDGFGNIATQEQTIIVEDTEAPIPDISDLEDILGVCSVTVSTCPTATDNCAGEITAATTDPLEYTEQGTYTITWSYDDSNGNISTQEQTIIVEDTEAPIPDISDLEDILGVCSVTVSTYPTATDNCAGEITAAATDPLEYTEQGTYTITWTYDDSNGNISTQEQIIIVEDTENPTITCVDNQTINLSQGQTFYTVQGTEFDPTAYDDNCETESIENDYNNSETLAGEELPEGTTTIVWTVTDASGNTTECSFDVTVNAFVGIADFSATKISIYPNPTTGIINLTGFAEPVSVKITDITGKTINNFQIDSFSNFQINISHFQNGIYFLKITTNTEIFTKKIIKN